MDPYPISIYDLNQDVTSLLPKDWIPMNNILEKYRIVRIPIDSPEYEFILNKVMGNYYQSILGIYKVQHPFMFLNYLLKIYHFHEQGSYSISTLFHDTSEANALSISEQNLDWRYGCRFKFGTGVYFSKSAELANRHSRKQNGKYRSMFVFDVLIQNICTIDDDTFVPNEGYDTALCHFGSTYVKYYNDEYYPRYFFDYISVL